MVLRVAILPSVDEADTLINSRKKVLPVRNPMACRLLPGCTLLQMT